MTRRLAFPTLLLVAGVLLGYSPVRAQALVSLGTLGGADSGAYRINASGQVVG